MTLIQKCFFYLIILLVCLSPSRLLSSWSKAVSLGGGCSRAIGHSYTDCLTSLTVKWHRFPPIDPLLYATIDSTVAMWHANTPLHRNLASFALSAAFRAYFFSPNKQHQLHPFLLATVGPAITTNHTLGVQTQGSLFVIQTTLGGGVELPLKKNNIDLNLRMVHICNAGLFKPNHGYEVMYVLSLGYLYQ